MRQEADYKTLVDSGAEHRKPQTLEFLKFVHLPYILQAPMTLDASLNALNASAVSPMRELGAYK